MNFLDKSHTIVIAEAGSNWKIGSYSDDLKQAKKLIDIAAQSGADVVKFQTFRADTVYAQNPGQADYLSLEKESINELFEKNSMPYEMLQELSNYCKIKKIDFMSTPFSVEDAKAVDPYVSVHKIASFEINHLNLLKYIAKTKKPVLVSTGASTYEDIDFLVKFMKEQHSGPLILLQCTSSYPAPLNSLNLKTITKMQERYNIPIGFSDHSMNPIIGPITAIGLGAIVIEKHFTSDRNLPGPDHKFALTPEELLEMVKMIRDADVVKGDGVKKILGKEQELWRFAKRSIQASKNISKGEILKEGVNIEILRPGKNIRGEEPRMIGKMDGKESKKDIRVGEGIKMSDCNSSKQKLTKLSGKTFLITGAGGMLGRSFQEILNKFVDDSKIYALSKEELDVTNKEQVLSFQSLKPDFIIHCVSISSDSTNPVDYCETHVEESYDLYVTGMSNIIELAKLTHAKLFYPQTFLIFDGKSLPINEDSQPSPLSIYGKHKHQAQLLLNGITNHLVVIMGGFFGGRDLDKNFVGKITSHIANLIETGVTSIEIGDRVWQPTFTNDLAYNILFLLENNKSGKYTMASHGKASFYELTKEIVSILNIKNKIKIIPVSASKFSSKESAMRPVLALIENKKLTQENLDVQREWQDSLREYLSHSYFLNLFKS